MPETTRPVAAPVLPARVPLSRAPIGEHRVVIAVGDPVRAELQHEGLLPGCVVVVRTRTPLGGPLVVELGRTRIALSVDVADHVSTVSVTR
jgi:Fe2+ transport system protein FeoA